MPELPEVEVVRRGLHEHVVGRRIESVRVFDTRSLRRHEPGPADFVARLSGRAVVVARRRGKFLWLGLDDRTEGDALLSHLGMSGQLLVSAADAPAQRHLRIALRLDDGQELRFVDQRIFGTMSLSSAGALAPAEIGHIALDPLDPQFDDAEFIAKLRRRKTQLKRALLDQGLISGVGNIYADEALWRSRLHYGRATENLQVGQSATLLAHLREVFGEALAQGGTSFDALYVNVNGESGYFERSLAAYGQEGEPCLRCGTSIRRDSFMNRSSYFCPRCQRRPRAGPAR